MRHALAVAALLVSLAATASPANRRRPSLAELSGDVTVVAFWASWCQPCKEELPMLEALRQSLASDARVRVIAVSVDGRPDAHKARKLARSLGLGEPIVVEPRLYHELFGRRDDFSVPRLVVIDRRRAGLERNGARAGEARATFVREVTAAVASVEAGAPAPPSLMWRPFAAAPSGP